MIYCLYLSCQVDYIKVCDMKMIGYEWIYESICIVIHGDFAGFGSGRGTFEGSFSIKSMSDVGM